LTFFSISYLRSRAASSQRLSTKSARNAAQQTTPRTHRTHRRKASIPITGWRVRPALAHRWDGRGERDHTNFEIFPKNSENRKITFLARSTGARNVGASGPLAASSNIAG
jgi:hypothetical protein